MPQSDVEARLIELEVRTQALEEQIRYLEHLLFEARQWVNMVLVVPQSVAQ